MNLVIRMDAIVLDPSTQIRCTPRRNKRNGIGSTDHTDPETVKEYREAMKQDAQFPPLVVVRVDPKDEQKGFILIDGWHRFRAMQALERETTDVTVISEEDPNRFQWLAAQGNRTHGLKLTRKDKRNVFRAYVKAGEHRTGKIGRAKIKSARQMSKELQGIVSHRYLPTWMQQDFPSIYRVMLSQGGINEEPENAFGEAGRDRVKAKEIIKQAGEIKARFYSIRDMGLREELLVRLSKLLPGELKRVEKITQKDLDQDDEF